MIHVYTGEGKGKTTASVGLCVRAAGRGLSVLFMQFLKDDGSGEVSILRTVPGVTVVHSPVCFGFSFRMTEEQKRETAKAFDRMLDRALRTDAFLIVLDEVICALNAGMIGREKLESVLEKDCEIVLTGRGAPAWLIDRADYVSDITKRKHPFDRGIRARPGIEF